MQKEALNSSSVRSNRIIKIWKKNYKFEIRSAEIFPSFRFDSLQCSSVRIKFEFHCIDFTSSEIYMTFLKIWFPCDYFGKMTKNGHFFLNIWISWHFYLVLRLKLCVYFHEKIFYWSRSASILEKKWYFW